MLCTNTRLRAKGFPYLSQPGVPALGEHPCWGLRLSTATPKVPSHVPYVNPALVVFDLCHLLTETLRHREGKKLAQGHRAEKNRSPQQAGQSSHLLLSSFTTRPSLAPTRLGNQGSGQSPSHGQVIRPSNPPGGQPLGPRCPHFAEHAL